MRDHDQKYYLVKSGEVKKRAEEYRETYLRLKNHLWKIISAFGVKEASIDKRMMLIRGLYFRGAPPTGWTKPNRHGLSRPKDGTLKLEVRKFFTPSGNYWIETHAELKPFGEWLGCPFSYSWESKDGKMSGCDTIGRIFSDGFVYWYDKDGPIALELPDVAGAKKSAAEHGRIVKNNVLDWVPPKGLKEILKEEWDLMAAKHERAKQAKEAS